MRDFGVNYGDFLVYGGLWEVVYIIWFDFVGWLVIVFMVLEVRGFDVSFLMIDVFKRLGDEEIVYVLEIIY